MLRGMGWKPGKGIGKNEKYELCFACEILAVCLLHSLFQHTSLRDSHYIPTHCFYRIVATVVPELRPKGMGLGADKVTLQKQNGKRQKEEEELRMEKGSFVKIIAGKQSVCNAYGQIEGFDEDAGRLIVKMALGGDTISVNECTVQAVTKAEYLKNSKVLSE